MGALYSARNNRISSISSRMTFARMVLSPPEAVRLVERLQPGVREGRDASHDIELTFGRAVRQLSRGTTSDPRDSHYESSGSRRYPTPRRVSIGRPFASEHGPVTFDERDRDEQSGLLREDIER